VAAWLGSDSGSTRTLSLNEHVTHCIISVLSSKLLSCAQMCALHGATSRFTILRRSQEPRGTGKVCRSGLDVESETMVRPICAALVVTCLSTSAFAETCVASRYGYSGGRTASGERMDPNAMTAAHRTRPFCSHVTVTSHSTGRSVTVRINDRGPFVKGRCIDLSTGAAQVLGLFGIARVSLDEAE